MNRLREATAAVFADLPATLSAEEALRRVIQAEAAQVIVLNGTQEEGLAARTAERLRADGFNVLTVGNAERADYAESWLITNGDSAPQTREVLLRRFNISPDHLLFDPPSDGADLTLIIGADHGRAVAGQ
jgi:hypothetical protein